MKLIAIVKRVIKELIRDKRTLALMFLAPILILALMYFVFNGNDDKLKLGVGDSVSSKVTDQLPSDKLTVKHFSSQDHIRRTIESHDLDGFIYQQDNNLHVIYTNEDPSKSNIIKQMVGQAIQKDKMGHIQKILTQLPPAAKKGHTNNMKLYNNYLYGDADSTYFDKMFPILMGFFVFLFVFLISGIALLRERTTGTLERVLSTSIKRSEIVVGYLIGYGMVAVLQTLIIVLFSIYLLNISLAGSLWYVLLTNILLAITALAIGLFVSTFANSEFQMIQFIPIIVVPQVFFSGIFPLENMPGWLGNIGYLFPLRYAGDALTNVMIKGQGWNNIWFDLFIILIFTIIFTILNIIGLKRYRKV